MQMPKNIIKHELIGLHVKILESKNKSLVGLEGQIVDETKNMLTIKTNKGEKKVIKNHSTFELQLPNGEAVEVLGSILVGRPEARLKTTLPKKRV